ncbi:conserved Plasmodium protein, unknown function, partial [Plasmodium ovale curtisi]
PKSWGNFGYFVCNFPNANLSSVKVPCGNMCDRLYNYIRGAELESNLCISNNRALFVSIYDLMREGVPIPSSYYINEKIVDRETDRYIMTKYIYDIDDIIYKIEAHSKIKLKKENNIIIEYIEENYIQKNEIENIYIEDKYNKLDSIQIYISYNKFSDIWNLNTMQYFLNCYNDNNYFKIHTHILNKEESGYNLQIELYEIPTNPLKIFIIANHLSKIREALLCCPFMYFFLEKIKSCENIFEKMIIRKNEIIFTFKKNDYIIIIISIHYENIYDKFIILGLCKNIHTIMKTLDLSGNLDCSFYEDFPSHLIPLDLFVYNNNYIDNYTFETTNGKNSTKIPNVGFLSLKMDLHLFSNCNDFSELIKISSKVSHIIVSFRDFLNNALVLYRIKRRRAFSTC